VLISFVPVVAEQHNRSYGSELSHERSSSSNNA
jgi:hypothetical protein